MLPADNHTAALEQTARFRDTRISQYWDSHRAFGRQVAARLQLLAPIAWDIYLLYPPGFTWNAGHLPLPAFWMHQLDERPDRYLDSRQLESAAQNLLESIPAKEK